MNHVTINMKAHRRGDKNRRKTLSQECFLFRGLVDEVEERLKSVTGANKMKTTQTRQLRE